MTFHFTQNPDGTYTYNGSRGAKPKHIKSPFLRLVTNLLITLVVGFLYFYFKLPALNFQDMDLYGFVILLLLIFMALTLVSGGFKPVEGEGLLTTIRKKARVPFYLVLALVVVLIIGGITGWVVFRAPAYSALLPLDDGDFTEEVAEIALDQIPMLDSTSAAALADRKLGELKELVSQFTVNDTSAQINYLDRPVRVSYLDYGDPIKWLNNRSSGIPAYMVTDMVTQEVTVHRMENGIRYSPSEYFGRDIYRHLRFNYPTAIFGNVTFEIDEEGTPYWIASVVEKTIGLFGGTDVKGAVLVNAITGDHVYHDVADVPTWVDRVYPAALLIEQYDYYGRYHNGFFNSIFGQRDCTITTDGYNYIAMDDDVWMYTGITSVSADRGNIGFILVNQRTKEARYYTCAGAEEYSAMSSAQGAVQQFKYTATFPLLLNISDQPTYFMALKDASQLVKMYALVNVQQYQIVATGSTVEECVANYEEMLLDRNIIDEEDVHIDIEAPVTTLETSGVIADIRSAVIDGNTYIYLQLVSDETYYILSAAEFPQIIIFDIGDRVSLAYDEAAIENGIVNAQLVEE